MKTIKTRILAASIIAVVSTYASAFTVAQAQTVPGSGTATGTNATANDQGTATGYQANADINAVATGFSSRAAQGAVAEGSSANAALYGTATGYFTYANQYGVADGYQASSNGMYGVAVGPHASANGQNDISIGNTAGVTMSNGENVAIGSGAGLNGGSVPVTGTVSIGSGAGQGITNSFATSIGYQSGAYGANSVALGAYSTTNLANDVSVGSPGNERTISNVAPATQGTQAVNLNQLNAALSGLGSNPLAVSYDNATFASLTLQGASGTVIHNVGAGVAGTDAVNLNQLNRVQSNLQSQINALATTPTTPVTTTPVTVSSNDPSAIHYDNDNKNIATLAGSNGTVLRNVGAGSAPTDAVNVEQLNTSIQAAYSYTNNVSAQTLQQANTYTDQKFAGLDSRIDNLAGRIDGIGAMAAANGSNMYNNTSASDTQVGVGVGAFRGAVGYSVGVFHRFSPSLVANLKVSGATHAGGTAVGAGFNYGFK
ncbi:YadA domain-containing protein [Caballeronia peredens]|nr:YadA domain-containing protein [Caballeronia peredens]